MSTPVINVKNLHLHLDNAKILRGIDFTVQTGEMIAILGPNGSGKSTLIRSLVNTISPSSGSIEIFGTPLTQRTKVPWEKIGYAPQRNTATSGVPATALETVSAGLTYGKTIRASKDSKNLALAALEKVGLAYRAYEAVHNFSGGQQQRVLLARAIAKNPVLLLLDEPFTGVDKDSRERIIQLLHSLKNTGVTIIIVLHELYGMETIIDRAIMLEHGKIAQILSGTQLTNFPHECAAIVDSHHAHTPTRPHTSTPALGEPC